MKNEFGRQVDRNWYADSIIDDGDCCYLCGRRNLKLDRHEPFNGSNREKSKRFGMWVLLCRNCHEKAHSDGKTGRMLKQKAQECAMREYDWDEEKFIEEFGKNYI
jgi:hypothetical protein